MGEGSQNQISIFLNQRFEDERMQAVPERDRSQVCVVFAVHGK